MVAHLVPLEFDREGWLLELKWDGFRAIAEMDAVTPSAVELRVDLNDSSPLEQPVGQFLLRDRMLQIKRRRDFGEGQLFSKLRGVPRPLSGLG